MNTPRKPFFYGWIIVAAGFLINFVNTGLLLYTFSIFASYVGEALSASRTQVALASSLYTLGFVIISPIAGAQMAKGNTKWMLLLGALLGGGGFLLLSITPNIFLFYVFYIIVGLGMAFAGPAIHTALPAYWFERRKGLAVGIVNCGAGVGAIIAPKLVVAISQASGWRTAYVVLGVISIVILVPLALFIVKTKPQDMGLLPDGMTEAEAAALPRKEAPANVTGLTRKQAMKTPAFWLIGISMLVLGIAQIGVMQNQTAHLTDINFDLSMAAGALGIVGLMTTLSKFVFGWLVDQFGYKVSAVLGNLCLVAGILVLAMAAPGQSPVYMYIYAVLYGFGMGSWTPFYSVGISKMLGMKFYGSVWGGLFAIRTVGDMIGVPVMSKLATLLGGYRTPLIIAAAAVVVSTIIFVLMQKPKAYADLEREA